MLSKPSNLANLTSYGFFDLLGFLSDFVSDALHRLADRAGSMFGVSRHDHHHHHQQQPPPPPLAMNPAEWSVATLEVILNIADRCGEREAIDALHTVAVDDRLDELFASFYRSTRSSPPGVDVPSVDPALTRMYGDLVSAFRRAARV